jgi:2-polyprenyl-6-methoxyphenol hydroxylase-like FAD-dependent oxidoreductase
MLQVGGSLAGLLTGLALKRLGHDVRILERSPSSQLQTQGTGIVFGPQVQEYFNKLIRMRGTYTVPSYRRQTVDGAGKSIPEFEDQIVQQLVSWDLVYFVLRGEFDGLASGYSQRVEKWDGEGQGKGTYEYGCVAVGIRDKGEKIELEFVDREGQTQDLEADLVIGADGPSSTIRRILLPGVERKNAGYVAWRGTMLENEATKELKEMVTDCLPYFFDNAERTHIVA